MITGYKFLTDEIKSSNGDETWKMDTWKEHSGKLELCASGFHACRTPLQSLKYIYGNRWFVVEADGDFLEKKNDKFVCSRMRIIHELPLKKIMLRFAIACAKNSLFRYEISVPQDDRPRKAIEIAEAILLGELIGQDAESAARSAVSAARSAAWSAESAARSAAWSAAWSAESAVSAARSAESAARSAVSAESAAWSAESAAWSAAESAERKWQEKKLQQIIFQVAGV